MQKKVATRFGTLTVPQQYCLLDSSHHGFGISAYLQEVGCYVGQLCPFDEASELLKRLADVALCDKQIERLCHHHGRLLASELHIDTVEGADQTPYYLEMDGGTVLNRADQQQPSGWKELKLARLFKVQDVLAIKQRTTIRHSDHVAHLGDHA